MNYVRVGGYIPPQPIEDYNDLPNIPVQNQDLAVSGFTPVANSYYRHIGETTASFTNGVIYLYNGTGYAALDGAAVNNGTLTIQQNGTNVATFGANQSSSVTANITVPTKASDVNALPISGGTITGNLTVGGNLTINGTTTTVDSTTLQVKDKLIEVAHGNTTTLTTPAGLVAPKYDGTNSGALVFDSTGTAYVGDVTLKDGNIDVANSDLQTLATRTGLVGGNLVQYDSSAQTLKDAGKKISDLVTTNTAQTISGSKTFTGEVKFGSTENFQGYYIKRMIGSLSPGTAYNNLDSLYKDGTYHRMWRLRFPKDSSFWGKIKVTLYGGYSSFNASGVMSKSITCNFNTSNIYNNVGCYDGLGVNVEQDFRISEAIWNATVSAWEVLIWQKNLNGNNSPTIMLECWTTNNTNYINAFNGIAAQTVELTQSTSYSAQRASSTGGTKTVEWATLPVYENPLGEEIATMSDLSNKANLNGGNIFSGVQTINAPTNVDGSEQTTMKVKTSNGGAIIFGKEGANSGTMIRLDQADGTCRLRFRSSKTAGAMVWEQPEQGAKLHVDLGKDGSDKHRVTFPSSAGTLALTSQIHNGTLTIQQNGTKVQTFTANQSSSVTANITVPTKTSDLTNDSGFITSDGSVKSVIDYNNANNRIKIGYSGDGLSGDSIKYIAGYITGDSESAARIKDINKDSMKNWLGYATVATSGSYNDLVDKPSIPANYTTLSRTPSQCTANGFYYVSSSVNSLTDADGNPFLQYHASNNDFRILATAWGDPWVQQIATDFRSTHIYYRICNNGTWGAWTEIAKISDIPDISGKLDKTEYEVNRTINFGQDGVLYVGKFKVYDTNVTFEITSTTSVTYSGKLVIATQNYVIREAKVYGDAANTVTPNIYIKQSTTSDQYIEVYFKPESWSKNVIHIYGSNIQAEPTDICTNVPSVPSTATLRPKNALPVYSLSGTTFTITF